MEKRATLPASKPPSNFYLATLLQNIAQTEVGALEKPALSILQAKKKFFYACSVPVNRIIEHGRRPDRMHAAWIINANPTLIRQSAIGGRAIFATRCIRAVASSRGKQMSSALNHKLKRRRSFVPLCVYSILCVCCRCYSFCFTGILIYVIYEYMLPNSACFVK